MYLSPHQARLEVDLKQAEFARELKRFRHTESRSLYLLSNLVTQMRQAFSQATQNLFASPRTPSLSGS